MIKALLDFIWALKSHTEPFVRNSILFALTLILIVIPKNILLITKNNYFIEMKFWLESNIKTCTKFSIFESEKEFCRNRVLIERRYKCLNLGSFLNSLCLSTILDPTRKYRSLNKLIYLN